MSKQMPECTRGPDIPKIMRKAAEYNLTEHCNLRCAGCSHSSELLPKKFAEVKEFQRDLAVLSQVLHLNELKLLGGEPLLHPDLLEFLRCARASGLAEEITLVTNGLLLHRCDPATFELIDRLWVSLYPGVRLRVEERELESLSKRHNFKLELKRIDTFRVTTLNSRHRDATLVRRIFGQCALAHDWSCHTVHQGYYFKCSPAPFLTGRLALRGESVQNRDSDGVRIHDNPRLREELEAYLRDEEPLEACYYCLGSSGRSFPHRQLNSKELREEIGRSRETARRIGRTAAARQRIPWVGAGDARAIRRSRPQPCGLCNRFDSTRASDHGNDGDARGRSQVRAAMLPAINPQPAVEVEDLRTAGVGDSAGRRRASAVTDARAGAAAQPVRSSGPGGTPGLNHES